MEILQAPVNIEPGAIEGRVAMNRVVFNRREDSSFDQFAKEVQQHHFTNRAGGGVGDAGVADDDRQALGARDGNIYPVAVEDEAKAARTVFSVAGAEGKDADGSLLSLEPIDTPDPCSIRQSLLQDADLGVVRGDEKKVIQSQRPDA